MRRSTCITSITKVRELSFIPGSPETDGLDPDTESAPEPLKINKYRFLILNDYVSSLKLRNLVDLPKQGEAGTRNSLSCGFRIQPKVFYSSNRTNTIFEGCSKILMDHKLGLFEYNIDGYSRPRTRRGV
jgi:hypothetical protein